MSYCPYLKWEQRIFSSDTIECNLTNDYVPNAFFNNYCTNYNACGNCPNYKQYGPNNSSSCFITTVTCNILGKEDNDPVMDALRSLRDNTLQKDEKYFDILKEYDVIGPIIANKLLNDENKDKIAKVLYEDVLKPVSELVVEGNTEEAVEKYYVMTLMFVNYYGLKHEYNEKRDNDYEYKDFDPKKAGHGRKLSIKKEYQS